MNLNTTKLVNQKLENGDLNGAIEIAIAEAEVALTIAKDAIDEIEKRQSQIDAKFDILLDKYQIL